MRNIVKIEFYTDFVVFITKKIYFMSIHWKLRFSGDVLRFWTFSFGYSLELQKCLKKMAWSTRQQIRPCRFRFWINCREYAAQLGQNCNIDTFSYVWLMLLDWLWESPHWPPELLAYATANSTAVWPSARKMCVRLIWVAWFAHIARTHCTCSSMCKCIRGRSSVRYP